MAGHTPGPWRVEQDTNLVWGACNPDDMSTRGMGYPIVDAHMPSSWARGRPTQDERDANARLIAAAPEMLAALKRLLATINVRDAENHTPGCRCVIHEARAVIATAEGGDQS